MNNFKNVLWGIILVVLGVIIGTNSLGLTNIDLLFDGWWTLFIIVPCFIGLFTNSEKTGNIIGILIGVALFLGINDIIDFDKIWTLLLPLVIVVLGLSLIFKDTFNSKVSKEIKKINKENNKDNDYFAAFSGQNIDLNNEDFKGADLTAIFGGLKLDLRKANIDKDVVINASSIFGGIDILIPKDVNVKVKSTSLFGGVTNKKANNDNQKTIYINALCMFGGVEIK